MNTIDEDVEKNRSIELDQKMILKDISNEISKQDIKLIKQSNTSILKQLKKQSTFLGNPNQQIYLKNSSKSKRVYNQNTQINKKVNMNQNIKNIVNKQNRNASANMKQRKNVNTNINININNNNNNSSNTNTNVSKYMKYRTFVSGVRIGTLATSGSEKNMNQLSNKSLQQTQSKEMKKCCFTNRNPFFDDIDSSNFKMEKQIGKGAYGTVRECQSKISSNEKMAVKIYEKYRMKESHQVRNLLREVKILKESNHPNIIKILYALEDKRQYHIITPLIDSSLQQYVRSTKENKLNEVQAQDIIKQILEAVDYIHSNMIVHRDIKVDNILIYDDLKQVQIIDFGFACEVEPDQKIKQFCGTPQYMSPQIMNKQPFDPFKADIWAIGVVLFYMTQGRQPFKGHSEKDLIKSISQPSLSISGSQSLIDLINWAFTIQEDQRPTAKQMLNHQWLI